MFDHEIIEYLENHLEDLGIKILKEQEAEKLVLDKDDMVEKVVTSGGEELDSDLVFFGIGTRPNNFLAENAGISIGSRGSISVDEYYEDKYRIIYMQQEIAANVKTLYLVINVHIILLL